MKNRLAIILILTIFLIGFISSDCSVALDKDSYVAGQTATVAMSCSVNPEKNTAYNVNWTNSSGDQFELDSGTTPNVAGQLFYQSFTIPIDWPNGVWLNVSLNGSGLVVLQNDSANVTAYGSAGINTLEITNTTFGGGYLGLVSSVKAIITDENGKKISGGNCEISALSNDETRILSEAYTPMLNGMIEVSDIMPPTRFNEGTDYAYDIRCFCGSSGSATECIDEDGINVNNSIGSAKDFFTTKTYLNVNTITDKSSYTLRDFITICVNVTNIDYSERIPLEIDYQTRCSVGDDSNSDTDRILIFSDGQLYDKRGINSATTQMQCKKFIIPEIREYEGTSSTCYASSNVWVIGEDGNRVLDYPTTSSYFIINSTELNLKVDWAQMSNLTFNSIINLSSDSFKDWNGTNTGNIDIRLISPDETIDPNIRKVIQGVDLHNFIISKYIKSINVINLSGDNITPYLEFTDDGNLEIELRDQNLNQSGWYNVTVIFNDFEERQAAALEGINNKTGTFHLDVECPSSGTIGGSMDCTITSYVENSQIVQKEVDFTCYISDGIAEYSSLNFNQMISRNAVSVVRSFSIPSAFNSGQQYVLQCHADYYNLGSRRDSFYDTFTATLGGSANKASGKSNTTTPMTGESIEENIPEEEEEKNIINKFNPLSPDRNMIFIFAEIIIVIGITLIIFFSIKKKREYYSNKNYNLPDNLKKIFAIIIAILILVSIGAGILKGYELIKKSFKKDSEQVIEPEESSSILLKGNLTKSIFLIFLAILIISLVIIIFTAILVCIISKLLNIRGELKFGTDYPRKYYEDRKSSKLQKRLNKMILRDEIKKTRLKEDSKFRKMSPSEFREFLKKRDTK